MAFRPLGLVLKQGSWHLVSQGDGRIDVTCLDDLRGRRGLTSQAFVGPPGFDLVEFWRTFVAANRRKSRRSLSSTPTASTARTASSVAFAMSFSRSRASCVAARTASCRARLLSSA